MKKFRNKMPLKKALAYAFARVTGRDVMCSRMVVHRTVAKVRAEFGSHSVGDMNVYSFRWCEARPVKGDAGLYALKLCSYVRNGWDAVSGDRRYHESALRKKPVTQAGAALFTRAEAISLLKQVERSMLDGSQDKGHKAFLIDDAPASLRALNVHRRATARLTPDV